MKRTRPLLKTVCALLAFFLNCGATNHLQTILRPFRAPIHYSLAPECRVKKPLAPGDALVH